MSVKGATVGDKQVCDPYKSVIKRRYGSQLCCYIDGISAILRWMLPVSIEHTEAWRRYRSFPKPNFLSHFLIKIPDRLVELSLRCFPDNRWHPFIQIPSLGTSHLLSDAFLTKTGSSVCHHEATMCWLIGASHACGFIELEWHWFSSGSLPPDTKPLSNSVRSVALTPEQADRRWSKYQILQYDITAMVIKQLKNFGNLTV